MPRRRVEASDPAIVRANGVELCVQTFGDPADAAILLIHGANDPVFPAWDLVVLAHTSAA